MILNSSPIITFFQLNLENELTKLFQTGRFSFLIPYVVFNELRIETRKFVQKMVNKGIFALYRNKIDTLNSVAKLFPSLGNGELSVLSAYLEIKNYLKIIHQIPQKVFLQLNRLHFHLDLIFENYTNKVIHIIRHPLDVWLSIERAYDIINLDRPFFIKFARTILKPLRMKSQFEIEKNYNWILYKIGYPVNYSRSAKVKYMNKFNAFEKFIVVWTISNYIALQTLVKYNGLIIPYERILIEPDWVRNVISEFIGIHLKEPPNVKKGNYHKFDSKLQKKMLQIVDKYEIQEEFQFCLSFLKLLKGMSYNAW